MSLPTLNENDLIKYKNINQKILKDDKIVTGDKIILKSIAMEQKNHMQSSSPVEGLKKDSYKISAIVY